MSAAGARSATKKTSKIVLSAAALTASVGLATAAVIFGPAAAISREPDRAAQLDPRQGSPLVRVAMVKPAGPPSGLSRALFRRASRATSASVCRAR